jgi:molybdate transport system substrate-binding protein
MVPARRLRKNRDRRSGTRPLWRRRKETMICMGVANSLASKIVKAHRLPKPISSYPGAAELGFVASRSSIAGGSRWLVPAKLHAPIPAGGAAQD